MKVTIKNIRNFLLLSLSVFTLMISSCASTKNLQEEEETEDTYVLGKYAGVPPQYRAILQEQEEKNARLKEQQEKEEQGVN